jgi:hypothetical protein
MLDDRKLLINNAFRIFVCYGAMPRIERKMKGFSGRRRVHPENFFQMGVKPGISGLDDAF